MEAVQSMPREVWCFYAERRRTEFFRPGKRLRAKRTLFSSVFLHVLGNWNGYGGLWLVLPKTGALCVEGVRGDGVERGEA